VDFRQSKRSKDLHHRVAAFMGDYVFPAEAVHHKQLAALRSRHHESPIMGE
jgi:acyl-CoA dehydrogenase